MRIDMECITCNINQVLKVAELFQLDVEKKEKVMKEVLLYLGKVDFNKSNPDIMMGTWDIIIKHIGNEDPYKNIREVYNNLLLGIENDIKDTISNSVNKQETALKVAIAGNLIDFGAKHEFDKDELLKRIDSIEHEVLAIDHSNDMFDKMKQAKTLLYLGDNCGEIVLDKIFIEYLTKEFKDLKIYFAVRGKPILNDVLMKDAMDVGIDKYATIVSNGDSCPGTNLERSSKEFNEIYKKADFVIAKGQGNFESLCDVRDKDIFFLFMVKCQVIANYIGTKIMNVVCVDMKKQH